MYEDYTEADTSRKFILPKLQDAGWETPPHSLTQEKYFTDGRIIVVGNKKRRKPGKKADFLLRYTRDRTIAVVEAKKFALPAGDGMQQAKEYAEILGLKFAYASNGREIIEFDFTTGEERLLDGFPTPDELWARLKAGGEISDEVADKLETTPYFP